MSGKKKGGLGEGSEYQDKAWYRVKIFALLRLRLERFRFSLIKRKSKQKIFLFLIKRKNCARKN